MNKHKHMVKLRRRLMIYLRDHGYLPSRGSASNNDVADMIADILEMPRVNESGSNYLLRIEKYIVLRGRDLFRQTPSWSDRKEINSIYEECKKISAETGIPHHVDHVIPVKGRNVSGLHVPANLAIITAKENLLKSNKYN